MRVLALLLLSVLWIAPAQAANVSGSMSVSGSFVGGQPVAYTVVLTNSGTIQNDNLGNEFFITLSPSLVLVSCTSATGTPLALTGSNQAAWSGSIAAGGSVTINITATVTPTAPGTFIIAQGAVLFDGDGNGSNESAVGTDDPATPVLVNDATSFTTVARSNVTGTMAAMPGIRAGSSNITYTVVLTNTGPLALNDNPSNEFITTLPSTLILVSCTSPTGDPFAGTSNNSASWSGSIPAGGTITITITATIKPGAPGTVISAQGTLLFDRNGDNTNETTRMTDDPATGTADDATAITLVAGTNVTGSMAVSGVFAVGRTVTYAVRLQNVGPLALPDNPSNEFIVTLPSSLTLVTCTSPTGDPFANFANNSASWSGSIPVNGVVNIAITATINPVQIGTIIGSQGTILFDRNGDHTNETTRMTDDPGTPAPDDITFFTVDTFFADGFEG